MIKPVMPRAKHNGQQQNQHIQKPGDLMPAADDEPNHDPGSTVQKALSAGELRRKAQAERQPGVKHGQRKIRQIVHCTVEPVQSFHRGRHALNKSKTDQQCQCPGQVLLRRGQALHYAAKRPVQAEKQRHQHAKQRQPIPAIAENGRLPGQQKTGNVQPLPILKIIYVCVPGGFQQARQVEAVLLHHRMGAGRVDVIVCRGPRKHGQRKNRDQQQPNTKGQLPQPVFLRGRIMPEIHMHAPVTGCPASFAGSRSTVSPTRPNRARHQSPRYPRSGGCPYFPECLAVPAWKPAGRPPRHPGRST